MRQFPAAFEYDGRALAYLALFPAVLNLRAASQTTLATTTAAAALAAASAHVAFVEASRALAQLLVG